MIEVDVLGVRVEMPTNQPIVLLREREGGRHLPIWIGAAEAAAITYAQQGVVPPRPLTHDLMRDLLSVLGHELTEVRIVSLTDSVFHAALVIDGSTEVSARASDAIALALRTGAKVLVDPDVLEQAAILVNSEEDDEVEKFKEFLDHVSAEDFDAGGTAKSESGESGESEHAGEPTTPEGTGDASDPGETGESGETGETGEAGPHSGEDPKN